MKDEKGYRRISHESVYNHWMARVQKKHGEFVNEGKSWSDGEVDILLDAYVRGVPYDAEPGVPCLASVLRRSREAVKCKLYKLAVRHPQGKADTYKPGADRPKGPDYNTERPAAVTLNEREITLVGLALSEEGRKHGAHEPDHLGKLLNRPAMHLRLWLCAARMQAPLMIKGQLPNETVDDWNARIVAEVMRKAPQFFEETL
jgi:hypothetical protein